MVIDLAKQPLLRGDPAFGCPARLGSVIGPESRQPGNLKLN
jgi:hypothetical protein